MRTLIDKMDVIVEDVDGSFLMVDEVGKTLDKDEKKREHGGSIRWAVMVASNHTLHLDCQSLPGHGETISGKPLLNRNNVPAHLLSSWDLRCDLFDGDLLAGPVLTLFGDDPDAIRQAICSDHAKTHWDLQKPNRHFIQPELVPLKAAAAVEKKPRDGATLEPFRRPRFSPNSLTAINMTAGSLSEGTSMLHQSLSAGPSCEGASPPNQSLPRELEAGGTDDDKQNFFRFSKQQSIHIWYIMEW